MSAAAFTPEKFVATKLALYESAADDANADSEDARILREVADELARVLDAFQPPTTAASASSAPPATSDASWAAEATGETPAPPITVAQLAAQLDQSEYTTRNLLDRNLIPGARRKTDGLKNSPWLISADAPGRYLERFNEKEQE